MKGGTKEEEESSISNNDMVDQGLETFLKRPAQILSYSYAFRGWVGGGSYTDSWGRTCV